VRLSVWLVPAGTACRGRRADTILRHLRAVRSFVRNNVQCSSLRHLHVVESSTAAVYVRPLGQNCQRLDSRSPGHPPCIDQSIVEYRGHQRPACHDDGGIYRTSVRPPVRPSVVRRFRAWTLGVNLNRANEMTELCCCVRLLKTISKPMSRLEFNTDNNLKLLWQIRYS